MPGVAGGLLPVDRAPVHAGAEVGKRVELRAFADLAAGELTGSGLRGGELDPSRRVGRMSG
jgi:hypothetical protein